MEGIAPGLEDITELTRLQASLPLKPSNDPATWHIETKVTPKSRPIYSARFARSF